MKKWHEYLFDIFAGHAPTPGFPPGTLENKIAIPISGTGYVVPQPPIGIEESRDLGLCHPELQRRYSALKEDFKKQTGYDLFETCTWRSAKKQQEYYRHGRRGIAYEKILTNIDGITKKSRHMVFPAEAVDVCIDSDMGPGKQPIWNGVAYLPLKDLCLKHCLVWGGDWAIHDFPHIELPA